MGSLIGLGQRPAVIIFLKHTCTVFLSFNIIMEQVQNVYFFPWYLKHWAYHLHARTYKHTHI